MSVFVLSPICTVKDGSGSPVAVTTGVSVVSGDSITIQLQDSTGVDRWDLRCVFASDGVPLVKTANPMVFTAGDAGKGYIFDSIATGLSASNLVQRFAVYVKASGEADFQFPSDASKYEAFLLDAYLGRSGDSSVGNGSLGTAEAYADAGDATTLVSAKAYVDSLQPTSFTGTTPGLATNESVELLGPSGQQLTLTDGTAYRIEVDTIVAAVDSISGHVARMIITNKIVARRDSGVVTLVNAGQTSGAGDAATSTYAITISHDTSPERVKIVFATGVGTMAACKIQADVSLQEQIF